MRKSLFTSKTFWFNVFSGAAMLADVIPLPPGTVAILSSVINIALRVITTGPVRVLTDAGRS